MALVGLERRVDDSGGRRERLRALETAVERIRAEKDGLGKRAAEALEALERAEHERDVWKRQAAAAANSANGTARAAITDVPADSDFVSSRVRHELAALRAEITALRAAVRHLGAAQQSAQLTAAKAFLATPLAPTSVAGAKPKQQRREQATLAHEAGDVLKAIRELVSRPESQVVRLKPRTREERATWRPAQEEVRWQVGRQREAWEAWREWRDDVGARTKELSGSEGRINRTEGGKPVRLQKADAAAKVEVLSQEDGQRTFVEA